MTRPAAREHARLTVDDDSGLTLEDLGSSNGTWVEGEQISAPVRVGPSQEVRLGVTALLLHTGLTEREFPNGAAESGLLLPPEFYQRDRYVVGEEVAKGGMGAVLQAREVTTRRTVAMKVMLGATEESAPDQLRFIEEAQITAQLEHPNIVPVHELGADGKGRVFYTMKLVQGITLKKVFELLAQGVPQTVAKYPLSALLTIFQKVCDAVAFAHSKGVIHRDLKPANIMIGHFGEVLVMDWGLAKAWRKPETALANGVAATVQEVESARADRGENFATREGSLMGTPPYMSPEQARGEVNALNGRSDIFSLGIIFYQLLTLRLPFSGKNARDIMQHIGAGAPVVPPLAMNKGAAPATLPHCPGHLVPQSLSAVALKALAFERERRYQEVKEMQDDLLAFQTGFATTAEQASLARQLRLFLSRHRKVLVASAAVLLLCAAGFAGFQYQQYRGRLATSDDLALAAASRGRTGDWDGAIAELQRAQVILDRPSGRRHLRDALFAGARGDLDQSRWGAAAIKLQELLRLFPDDRAAGDLMPFALGQGFVSIHTKFPGEVYELLLDGDLQHIPGPAGERLVGPLPVENLRLPQGPRQFELRRDGRRWCSLSVDLKRAGRTNIDIPVTDIPEGYEYIHGGEFIQGDEGTVQADGTIGKRSVNVPGFFMRSTVVTGGEYFRFRASPEYAKLIDETFQAAGLAVSDVQGGAQRPQDLTAFKETVEAAENLPVRGLCLYEAMAMAKWAGARLPTEEEWEKAARGVDGRIFATGNVTPRAPVARMMQAFRREGSNVSPFGCFALSDAMWQWTTSLSEPGSVRYITKGGPGYGLPTDLKPASRRPLDPKVKYSSAGVIFCRDLPPSP